MEKQLMNAKELAEITGLKLARIYDLTRRRKIPFILIGDRQYRYSAKEIERFIEAGGNRDERQNEGERHV